MSNIVEAQNKVLSKFFGVDCHVLKLEFEVSLYTSYQDICSGRFFASLEFASMHYIDESKWGDNGYKITEQTVQRTGIDKEYYCYKGILLYKSKVMKKLLKAMVKYS